VTADPFDLIRKWFQAFNSADIDALTALYHQDASIDAGSGLAGGHDGVRRELDALLQRSAQRTVRMIARVETGAMHAEWRGHERQAGSGDLSTSAGYASSSAGPVHFGIGSDTSVDLVEIHWPSGIVQQLKNVTADQIVAVSESSK